MHITIIGQAAFGAAVYQGLRADGHTIGGVCTPPETGRPDALAEAARAEGVAVVQASRWQRKGEIEADVFQRYRATEPELNVMAFVTQIIPAAVLNYPREGTIQFHPSLLPKHRGRSAINHALLQGEEETGLTIFWVDEGIDTGPILLQRRCPIEENDTVNSLYRERLFPLGVDAIAEAVRLVAVGSAPRLLQEERLATYEPPWEGEVARIDWALPAAQVHNLIRGSDRQPGAWTTLGDAKITLYGSSKATAEAGPPGSVARIGEGGLVIRCGDATTTGSDAVQIETAQAAGGKAVPAAEWARSASVKAGARFA